jgi:predicted RNA-binding protein with PIN domain
MPYLIDGHNLVPKLGLRLDAADDELELIEFLQEYSRRSRKAIEVYFDGALPGQAASRKFGQVTAHFVSRRSTADAAIIARLRTLGRAARNWTVVSSDREVLEAALAYRAVRETSEQFASRLRRDQSAQAARKQRGPQRMDGGMSEDELKQWMEVFKKR